MHAPLATPPILPGRESPRPVQADLDDLAQELERCSRRPSLRWLLLRGFAACTEGLHRHPVTATVVLALVLAMTLLPAR